MNETKAEDLALFRYEFVYPVISGTYQEESRQKYYETVASQLVRFPDGKMKQIKPGTLRDWVYLYRKHGLSGLKPKGRGDKGSSRSLTPDQATEIRRLKVENPRRTATSIHRTLIKTGFYPQGMPSISTVQRYLAKVKPDLHFQTVEDMKAFEMAHINELWQIDTTHGPWITLEGRKRKVYIIAIIDDASRLLVGYGLYLEDNALNVQQTFKEAIQTYGKPRRLFTDNGKPYVNRQLKLICASLGIGLTQAAPYHGNQKGKIERWFGVMKTQWMHNLNDQDFTTLEDLEKSFATYVVDRNNQSNRMLPKKQSPLERFSVEAETMYKVPKKELAQAFLHREERTVANDGTISLFSQQFETGHATIGQRVTIRYQPDLSSVYLEWQEELHEIKAVNKVDNSRMKRQQIRLTEVTDS